MRAAVIVGGAVANVIEVESLDVIPGLIDGEDASIGDLWDGEAFTKQTVPIDLPATKAAKNADINRWRGEANQSTFPHAGKLISCDPLSRSDIDGVANNISLFGVFPPDFPGAWKATDNTLIPMPDIDAFKAMYAAMTAQGTENFNHSQALKDALAEAATADDVAAIVW